MLTFELDRLMDDFLGLHLFIQKGQFLVHFISNATIIF